MTQPVHYGQLKSEKLAEENETCRKIVREIANFGVSQRQQLMIIYLLSLELENVEHMRTLTLAVKQLGDSELFLSPKEEQDGSIDA